MLFLFDGLQRSAPLRMNFSPFGTHFPSSIPTIHQFAAKFSPHDAGGVSAGNQNAGDNVRYHASPAHFSQHHAPLGMPGTAGGRQGGQPQATQMMKQYAAGLPSNQAVGVGNHYAYVEQKPRYHGDTMQPQDLCQQMGGDKDKRADNDKQEAEYSGQQQQQQQQQQVVGGQQQVSAWQTLAAPGSAVADYLSHLTPSTLHLSLNHFLKYSAESIKKEAELPIQPPGPSGKKKKKKKAAKEKKPRPKPGEIRLTTALDGSTLFCCPECNIAYPDKELLEQHLLGHTLERRFICDICGAGLKRKDHLTRHKQSHNPERPYVCTVCLKAFKRKEQLTLHFVIHSGEKRHVCSECGKGFYRKDHLRKHTRSHIARRVKAELSQGGGAMQGGGDMS